MPCFQSAASKKKTVKRKLVIVGDGACGKTSLLTVFRNGTFKEDGYIPTIFDNFVMDVEVDGTHVELALWDTAGQEEYGRLRYLSYPESDVVLIAYSVDDPESFENIITTWKPEVQKYCRGLPIILVACKADLRSDPKSQDKPMVTKEQGEQMSRDIEAAGFVECSAKTSTNIAKVFDRAVACVLHRKRLDNFKSVCSRLFCF